MGTQRSWFSFSTSSMKDIHQDVTFKGNDEKGDGFYFCAKCNLSPGQKAELLHILYYYPESNERRRARLTRSSSRSFSLGVSSVMG